MGRYNKIHRATRNINALIQKNQPYNELGEVMRYGAIKSLVWREPKTAGAEAEKVASAGQVHRGTCLGLRTEVRKIKSAGGERIENYEE